jgi:hypothetical protein
MLNKQSVAMVGRIVVLASFALLGGCRRNTHVLRIIVHGPVITAPTNEGTTIVVPAVDPGDQKHFLATGYPSVEEATSTPCPAGAYEFSLKGFKPAEKKAGANTDNGDVIDPDFDPITFTRPNWKPLGQPHFVIMHFPAATRIAALGSRYPVQFQSGPDVVPLTQVLEFEVRDGDDIRLVRTCGSEKKEYKALSCKEMQAKYDEVLDKAFKAFKDLKDFKDSQDAAKSKKYIDFALKCTDDASYLFVGIGIHPNDVASSEVHGRNFFNSKILPEIYGGAANVPQRNLLVAPGYFSPKGGGGGGDYRGVRLIQTSFDGEDPLYVPVLMIENCTAPGGFVHP